MSVDFDKNIILYGPPGTGKTYYTAIYAVAICDGKSIEDVKTWNYNEIMDRYHTLISEGRTVFTTFHQSYGYEEFIEGIKPVVDADRDSSNIGYKIEAGIFKRFCENSKIAQDGDLTYTGTVWFVRNRAGDTDVPEDFEQRLYTDSVIKVEDINDHKRQCDYFPKMVRGDWVILGREDFIHAIGVIADNEPEEIDNTVFRWQRRVNWLTTGLHTSCREINSGKGFSNFAIAKSKIKVEALQKSILKTVNNKAYVFIIDEINRGNISKIFGEIITLIEDTKRDGMPEAVCAVLPYSGEHFSVPSNVYILGTMNTADRSIALMDTALRRRFQFIEMMPDPNVLRQIGADKVGSIDISAMLEKINNRITYLYDREHTIGHAFFTKLKDPENQTIEVLASIFEKSIIPLLQEYFYEDYEKIRLVLGDNDKTDLSFKFIISSKDRKEDNTKAKVFKGDIGDIDLPECQYSINTSAFSNVESYKQIY